MIFIFSETKRGGERYCFKFSACKELYIIYNDQSLNLKTIPETTSTTQLCLKEFKIYTLVSFDNYQRQQADVTMHGMLLDV